MPFLGQNADVFNFFCPKIYKNSNKSEEIYHNTYLDCLSVESGQVIYK